MNQDTERPMRGNAGKGNKLVRSLLRAVKPRPIGVLPAGLDPGDRKLVVNLKPTRVFGPYAKRKGWRLLLRQGTAQKAISFATREEAEEYKGRLQTKLVGLGCRTVGEAVDELLILKRENGNTDRSVQSFEHKIRFLPCTATLASLTPQDAERLYRSQVEKYSVATHHKSLRSAKALFEFCIKRRYVQSNPFKDIRPIGKASAGKPQLRRDEAKKLSTYLLRIAAEGNLFALALSVQLLFGLRSGEVLRLRKRDIDADGSMLIVDGTKTKNARRSLQIESPVIRRLLTEHALTLGSDSLLFGQTAKGKPLRTSALHRRLLKFCRHADVPEVCPHSLRGLHSSLAVSGGATSGIVAAALGHGSDAITLKHYIEPSALDAARSAQVSAALLEPEIDTLIGTLRALSPAQLARVLSAIGNDR